MEMVDKFDKKRLPLNKVTERYDRIDGEYKLSMHLWIQNESGEFLIQKRSNNKKVFPGFWSITGGGVDLGETTLDTVYRECNEELGITANSNNLELVLCFKRKFNFTDIYLLKQNINLKDIVLQEEEVTDVKWVTIEEIREMIKNNDFAPNITFYFEMFIKLISEE
ncbi:MAG: NUDIX domain-containing protein [Clostridia bacterium]|nr:NUDIX domain-containing protein [Clostridia bacterium]